MTTCHAYPFPVWTTGSGLGLSFLFFLGIFCKKTGAGMRSAYSILAFAMPVSPALVLGTASPSQVFLLISTGQEGDVLGTQLYPHFRGMFLFAKS